MNYVALCLLALSIMIPAAPAQLPGCPSPEHLATRLNPGLWARVAHDSANNLRREPTTQGLLLGSIPGGDIFQVVDGPRCADGYVWWQVHYGGKTGWTAEGSPQQAEYWLEPLAGQPADSLSGAVIDPEGCQRPPDDYTQIRIGYAVLNARTLAMLDHAQMLYRAQGGSMDFRQAIMQGSYNPGGVSASFGTHDGGGAVDLSVRSRQDWRVLSDDIWPMIRALRLAGFAAWLRDTGELYPGSPIHIHAIAIGDAELSPAARAQIDGTFGYLRGYNGLPQTDNTPRPDTSGEMVICAWMVEMGFDDLRESGN
ncbi:MAG: SH3 domain-containing protein [Chloroflexi bacterium]|nr:SH3 domain-containing protein [Chloroflexota bacterium]MDL1885014.1 SH3 domain-containing protein [Anaerolineae bacterium CFX8]